MMGRPFESKSGEVAGAIVICAGALYLAIHIIVAALRGGFWRFL